jgi:hypothetical protein
MDGYGAYKGGAGAGGWLIAWLFVAFAAAWVAVFIEKRCGFWSISSFRHTFPLWDFKQHY